MSHCYLPPWGKKKKKCTIQLFIANTESLSVLTWVPEQHVSRISSMIRMVTSTTRTPALAWKSERQLNPSLTPHSALPACSSPDPDSCLATAQGAGQRGTNWSSRSKWKDMGRGNLRLALPPNTVPPPGLWCYCSQKCNQSRKNKLRRACESLPVFPTISVV